MCQTITVAQTPPEAPPPAWSVDFRQAGPGGGQEAPRPDTHRLPGACPAAPAAAWGQIPKVPSEPGDTPATTGAQAQRAPAASHLTRNAGGVPQAAAMSGAHPDAVRVIHTGTGTDKVFNVTNVTDREQSFTYSVHDVNKGTLTLKPGQSGAFVAGSGDLGVRIFPSDAKGARHVDTVLFEDGGAANGQPKGAGNPDVSKVDGDKDFHGRPVNMTITLSDGQTAGDGCRIRPYLHPTDDAAAMGLAGNPSKTISIVMSDPA